MHAAQCRMRPDHAPPGFWQRSGDAPALIDGVEIESGAPTRFFQTLDAYPPEWGRLSWRIQLNRLAGTEAEPPQFRTFYPGVEWNLQHPGRRWILTAWFRWEGPGPPFVECVNGTPSVLGDTALFRFAWMPKPPDAAGGADVERPLFLHSRVDARDRRSISAALRAQPEPPPATERDVIVLDDILEAPR